MRTATVSLESISPYSQSRYHSTPKNDKELANDYEARTWRNRLHVNEEGKVFIPPMAFKNCLTDAAQFLSIKIPGKRNATYTKHFVAGVLVTDAVSLPMPAEDVKGEWLFVPSDGKRGGGSRVEKCFPVIHKWNGSVTFYVLDDTITEDAFKYHIEQAGQFIGIGRFRPRNNGYYGRFKVTQIQWS